MSVEVSPWLDREKILSMYNCTTGQCVDVLTKHSHANTFVKALWLERGPSVLDLVVSLLFLFIVRKVFGSAKHFGTKLYYPFLLLILLTAILKKVLLLTFVDRADRVWCSDDDDVWCRMLGVLSFAFNYIHYFASVVFLFEICVALRVQSRFIPQWLHRARRVQWYFGTMIFTLLAYGLLLSLVFGFGKNRLGCSLRATNTPRSRKMLSITAKIAYLWPFPTACVLCVMLLHRIRLKLTINRKSIIYGATEHTKPWKLILFVPFVLLPHEIDTWFRYAGVLTRWRGIDCNDAYQFKVIDYIIWLRLMNGSFICIYMCILSKEVRTALNSLVCACMLNKNSGTTEGQERLGSILLGGVYISNGERLSHTDYGDESDEDAFPEIKLKEEYLPPLLAEPQETLLDGSDFRPDDVDD